MNRIEFKIKEQERKNRKYKITANYLNQTFLSSQIDFFKLKMMYLKYIYFLKEESCQKLNSKV